LKPYRKNIQNILSLFSFSTRLAKAGKALLVLSLLILSRNTSALQLSKTKSKSLSVVRTTFVFFSLRFYLSPNLGPPGQVAAISGKKAGMAQGELGGVLKELGYTEDQVSSQNSLFLKSF
jgi:hypothetical protein